MSQDFTLTGTGFLSNLGAVVAVSPLGTTPALSTVVGSDTSAVVSGAMAALAALGNVPPFSFTLRAYASTSPTGEYLETAAITVTVAVANPMSYATIVAYTGAPGEIQVRVTDGIAYNLAALGPSPFPLLQQVPYSPGVARTSWAFAAWFRRDGVAGALNTIASTLLNGSGTIVKWTNPSTNRVQFFVGPTLLAELGTYPDADMDWHHLATVKDGATGRIAVYFDGAPVFDAAAPDLSDMGSAPSSLAVGQADPILYRPCYGTGAVWFRALSPADIAAIWAGTSFP